MHNKKKSTRRNAIPWLAVLVVAAVLLTVGIRTEKESRVQARGTEQQQVGQRKRVQHNSAEYIEKTGLTTILLLGTDKGETPAQYGARGGGQADFQMLVVIDPYTRSIYRLQIDRDTIANVDALGLFGNPIGVQPMQICLAHAFGATPEECASRAVRAVENFFPGLETDICMSFDLASIGLVNDALGGVTVTLEDDFSQFDPVMTAGSTLTLNARQAEIFVRQRMEIGDGTNSARMQRQQAYISSAATLLKSKIQESTDFADSLLDALGDSFYSDASHSALVAEINRAGNYHLPPVETLPGSHKIGKDGFVEFHADADAALNWILRVLYEPVQ